MIRLYCDGSYNKKIAKASYGYVLINENNEIISEACGVAAKSNLWNVSGEIEGVLQGLAKAISLGISEITVVFDYSGLKAWPERTWKANKEESINYIKQIDDMKLLINIIFQKVKGHSGDIFNDYADKLAKSAIFEIKPTL